MISTYLQVMDLICTSWNDSLNHCYLSTNPAPHISRLRIILLIGLVPSAERSRHAAYPPAALQPCWSNFSQFPIISESVHASRRCAPRRIRKRNQTNMIGVIFRVFALNVVYLKAITSLRLQLLCRGISPCISLPASNEFEYNHIIKILK